MRRAAIALFIALVTVAAVQAGNVYQVTTWTNGDALINKFPSASLGACTYDITVWPSDRTKEKLSGKKPWPSDQYCTTLNGKKIRAAYSGGPEIQFAGGGNFDDTKRAFLYQYTHDLWSGDDYHDLIDTIAIPKSSIDGAPTAGGAVFSFAWCGEEIQATFDRNTKTPSYLTIYGDKSGNCNTFFQQVTSKTYPGKAELKNTGLYASNVFWTTLGTPVAYNLIASSNSQCSAYSLRTKGQHAGDWPTAGTTIDFVPSGANKYHAEWGDRSLGNNWLSVDLTVDTRTRAITKIEVDSADYTATTGGIAFDLLCDTPYDKDQDTNMCTAASYDWSDAVNASYPGKACCGDDGAADLNEEFVGLRCTDVNGQYKWLDLASFCVYPTGHTIAGLNQQQIDADAKTTYDKNFGCCSEQQNWGQVKSNSSEQAVCILHSDNRAQWFYASQANTPVLYNNTINETLVSDGSKFLRCGFSTPDIGVQTANTCTQTKNAKLSPATEFICLNKWAWFEPAQYTFDQNKKFINVSADVSLKGQVKYLCANQQLMTANTKDAPDFKSVGFCNVDQCYFGVDAHTTVRDACVDPNTYVLSYVCHLPTSASDAQWANRMQLLADTLYQRASDLALTNFVINCNADAYALNNPTNTAVYSALPAASAPFVNGFCTLSEPEGKTVAVGTTLNTPGGTQDPNIDAVNRPRTNPFGPTVVESLNSSTINVSKSPCNNALVADGNFHQCSTVQNKGKIFYNAKYAALLFSENSNFNLQNSGTDNFLAFWRRLFGGGAPDPIIDLSGEKVYVARHGGKTVQATLAPITGGGTQATVAYHGIAQATVDTMISGSRATNTTVRGDIIVRLDNPTQKEWEALTVAVRP